MKQDIVLFGGGYSLTRAANLLPKDRIVITSTKPDKVDRFRREGFASEVVSSESRDQLTSFFTKYPALSVFVDSAPPVAGVDPSAGVKQIVDLLKTKPIKRLVYLSTTGVFGAEDGEVVTEATDARPTNARSRVRLESEGLYRALSCEVIALRIAGIYGPGRGIGTALKRGSYTQIKGGERWSNRIHVEDLARLLSAVIAAPPSVPPIVCVADDEPAPISKVVDYYCKTFGLAAPQSISREEAIAKELHTMLSNQRVSNALMKRVFLPTLSYPTYREGAVTEFER